MADKNSNFNETVESLFKGLDGFLSTKTVVGDAIQAGEDILIPLADVSFGIGAGAFSGEKKDNGAGGLGAKMSPAAILKISPDGTTEMINLKSDDAVSKILDMAPGIVSRFTKGKKKKEAEKEAAAAEEE